MGIRSGVLSVKAAVNLYQALLLSIAEFSSEVWGFEKWQEGEQLQLDRLNTFYDAPRKLAILP